MGIDIENRRVDEIEKKAINDIESIIGYKFNILEKNELFYAFRPLFYPLLEIKYGWPPINDIFEEIEEINNKVLLAIVIEDDHITGLSINFDPRISFDITELPESFKNLKYLRYLVINVRSIKNVHQFLDKFPNLEFLSLLRLKFKPEIFKNLNKLKGLDLSNCSIYIDLIKEICKLNSLKALDLSATNLNSIDQCFHNLINLNILDLSENNFQSFPKNIKGLFNLEKLFLYRAGIIKIPKNTQLPENLKEIDLKHNNFKYLPENFENLHALEKIKVDSEHVAFYIRKVIKNLNKEKRKDLGIIDFNRLHSLYKKKKRFFDLLLKNGVSYSEASHVYKDLLPPYNWSLSFIESDDKKERRRLFETYLNKDVEDFKSYCDDLEWICEKQTTIKKVVVETDEKKRTFELNRLNIFVGKNNYGKTYALKQLYGALYKIKDLLGYKKLLERDFGFPKVEFESKRKPIPPLLQMECFFIPKSRIFENIVTKGDRKRLKVSLKELIESYSKLLKKEDIWLFDEIFEIINFFNSNKEISEIEPSLIYLFDKFHLILRKWLDILHSFFPEIDLKLPKRSDLAQITYEFDCDDLFIPSLSYNFNDLGSGMQELSVLIFFIEFLKNLPQIKDGKITNKELGHRVLFIDEPDLSLHPELQEKLFNYLIDASHRIQIILTTQSPFIPNPVENYISIKLFRKDNNGFYFDEITNNNFVLIQEELFRYRPLEIALYLSKNNFEYFKKLNYKSKEFSIGSYIKKRYDEDESYFGLLNLGTVNEKIKDRILQDTYFLSFNPETIDLNAGAVIKQDKKKRLRVFIIQVNNISDEVRKKLLENWNKNSFKSNSILRFSTLCRTVWNKNQLKNFVLQYDPKEQKMITDKVKKILNNMEAEIIENESLILFPENSLPYSLLPFLLNYSKKNKIVIIGGMEHCTLGNFNQIINGLDRELFSRYTAPIKYSELKANKPIVNNTFLNQAVIINANKYFTFQIKNIPFYFSSFNKFEGIPIILKPSYKSLQTTIGKVAVMICKDLLVNSSTIDTWMDIHDIKVLATPSFTNLVNPFRNTLGNIISNKKHKDKVFLFANVSEYGGSGAYSYVNRRDFEPNRKSFFPFKNITKEEGIQPSIEDWRKKDFSLPSFK